MKMYNTPMTDAQTASLLSLMVLANLSDDGKVHACNRLQVTDEGRHMDAWAIAVAMDAYGTDEWAALREATPANLTVLNAGEVLDVDLGYMSPSDARLVVHLLNVLCPNEDDWIYAFNVLSFQCAWIGGICTGKEYADLQRMYS